MKLEGKSDDGSDLRIGDIVYIKGKVTTKPKLSGDTKVRYYARPGFDEFARPSIAAIFLRRSRWNWLRRIFPKDLEKIETSIFDDYTPEQLEKVRKKSERNITIEIESNGAILSRGADEFTAVELDHIVDHMKCTADYYNEYEEMEDKKKRVAPMPKEDPDAIVSIPGD